MLMIRFQRTGRSNDPAFRIAVLEKERAAKAGNIVELLGTYNPKSKALTLNEESVKSWIAKGAQPTDSIKNLLITKGVIEGKKVNVLPRKSPVKSEAAIAAEVAAVAAAKAEADAAAKAASEPAPTSEVGESTESVGSVEAAPVAEDLPTEAEVAAEAEPAPVMEEAIEAPVETPAE